MDKWLLLSFAVAQLCQVVTLLRLAARNGAALDLLQKGETTFPLTSAIAERGATVTHPSRCFAFHAASFVFPACQR